LKIYKIKKAKDKCYDFTHKQRLLPVGGQQENAGTSGIPGINAGKFAGHSRPGD